MYKQLPCRIDCLAAFQYKYFQGEPDDCWLWAAGCTKQGYGQLTINGKNYSAHRISFFLANNYIDNNLEILHSCNNPPCVNPNHLNLDTQLKNVRQCIEQNRRARSDGENNNCSKLTNSLALELREKYAIGNCTITDLAHEYNLSVTIVNNIINGKTYQLAGGPISTNNYTRGEKNYISQSTNQEVIEIRLKWNTGKYTQQQLANEYNMSRSRINNIVNKYNWKHI